jgi:hypothetical protein
MINNDFSEIAALQQKSLTFGPNCFKFQILQAHPYPGAGGIVSGRIARATPSFPEPLLS